MTSTTSLEPPLGRSTKDELVRAARKLFSDQGYAATSLDAVVAEADVTKGALYHHFDGKRDLFLAVHADVEADAVRRIDGAADAGADPWDAAQAGLRAFLEIAREDGYRRLIIQDGPAVLGVAHTQASTRSTFATVRRLVAASLTSGTWEPGEDLVDTFSRIVFGALSSAGAVVATSPDPMLEATQVELSVGLLIAALRQLSTGHDSWEAAVGSVTRRD